MSLVLKVKKLDPRAKLPRYAMPGDAGFDIFSLDDAMIPAGERHTFMTGVALEIPRGYAGLMWDRGGHAAKRGLHSIAGVIDSSYRGELFVTLYNTGKEPVTLPAGAAIAQMIIQKVEAAEVAETAALSESVRGERRFSSTGV